MPNPEHQPKNKKARPQGGGWIFDGSLPILEAQTQFNEHPPTVAYAPINVASCQTADALLSQNAQFIVFRADVDRMVSMQLGHLPLRVISVPYFPTKCFPHDIFPALFLETTRTSEAKNPYEFDMKQQLSFLFPVKFIAALYELQSLFKRIQLKGYLIGGIARDLILTEDRKLLIRDVDITVEGQGHKAALSVDSQSRNFKVEEVYAEFGTAKLMYKDLMMLDFASTRLEHYAYCGAMPTITQRGVPLFQDIARRDFSINTLGLAIHDVGILYDYVNGLKDLEDRLIHVLTGATFFEDPSRMIRAFKFANRLNFKFSIQTEWLMQQCLSVLHLTPYKGGGARIKESLKEWLSLPPSRLKHELFNQFLGMQGIRLLMSRTPEASHPPLPMSLNFEQRSSLMESFQQLQALWHDVQHNLNEVFQIESPYCDPLDPDTCNERALWYVYLCYLFAPIRQNQALTQKLMSRLELTKETIEIVKNYDQLVDAKLLDGLDLDASALQLSKAFDRYESMALIAYVLQQENAKQWLEPLTRYLKRWRLMKPLLTGDDLMQLGVPYGESIGVCLKKLRYAKISGQVQNRSDEEAFVLEFIQQLTPPHPPSKSQGDA